MCRPTRCKRCGKTTWTGCGAHVENVRARVPEADWCPGHPEKTQPERRGFRRLLGR